MYWGYTIAGFLIGGFIASWSGWLFLGAIGGGVLGFLLARSQALDLRISELEAAVRRKAAESAKPTVMAAEREPDLEPDSTTKPEPSVKRSPVTSREPAPAFEATIGISDQELATASKPGPESAAQEKPLQTPWGWPQDKAAGPSATDKLLEAAKNWLTTGNLPVKVGVIVSFVGVSFLLKYAIDRRLLVVPLELRLLAVALAGLALVIIGWRLRNRMRAYALSLQGGGLGILFLTIFATFRIWELLPAPLAFALLLALTASTGALSVLQDSRSLAILGIVGGFLAPVLTSTGQGSHVALFSYYLLLNAAILGIAWFRAWRELNLIGFVFTFVIGSFWGYQYYKAELWASTQPFLLAHFLFYQAIAILYAVRQPAPRVGIVDGTLVFGTPVIAFALQYSLVGDTEYGLAISAAAVAVFYALTATALFRRKADGLNLITESFLALAVAFATIAIPLALDARWTSAAWSLEGAALVWLGVRQGRELARLAGSALILIGGLALFFYGWRPDTGLPVLNGNVLGGVLVSLSAFFASRKLDSLESSKSSFIHLSTTPVLFVWAVLWWLGTGWQEVVDRLQNPMQLPVFLLFLAVSFTAGSWLGRSRQWGLLQNTMPVLLAMLILISLVYPSQHSNFLTGLGWLAWPLVWAAQVYALRTMDESGSGLAGVWHFASLLVVTLMLAFESTWWVERVASDAWAAAAASAVAGVMALLVWRFRQRPAWPIPEHPTEYLAASLLLVTGQVIFLSVLCIVMPGDPTPLTYLPVLNPFDLGMLFAMTTALLSLAVLKRDVSTLQKSLITPVVEPYRKLLAGAFFLMTTAALIRAVHHFSAVPWQYDALFESVIVQTSLSIYWGLLGFAGMIWGARSKRRLIWLTGAGFMVLVVLKLFLVDLGNTGTVERIISFIGIGALLLVVGYLAPVPPRRTSEAQPGGEENLNEP